MKYIKAVCALLICFSVILLSSCKNTSGFSAYNSELKIGVSGIDGVFNPFYSISEADNEIISQMFIPIQRRGNDNSLINHAGGISYEFVGEKSVKYTVSIKDDLFFSDGTNIKIDDVVFYYYFISDATYDGTFKDWYLNDIEGLKEYYFDDPNYESSISNIEKTVKEKFTVSTIGVEDYVKYLVATKLEGKMNGDINEKSPSGMTWKEYIEKAGYTKELSALGSNPSQEDMLKLAATVEAEKNPLAYNPESWYREQLYTQYINKNYSNGIDVAEIEGIKKVNDYTCTVLFNSRNINAISQLNALLVSKSFYTAEYVKGSADKVKNIEGVPVCSGPYILSDNEETEVVMTRNEFYGDDIGFGKLRFIDLTAENDDFIDSVVSGNVDIVTVQADSFSVNSLSDKPVTYFISDCDYYTSVMFNTRTLPDSITRKALMGLFNVNDIVEKNVGSYYTRIFSPISIRFSEYPSSVTESYYNESAYTAYSMLSGEAIKTLSAYYCGSQDDLEYLILERYKEILSEKGISLDIILTDEKSLSAAILSGQADLWIENVHDGATCDKYDYFNSNGSLNKTSVNSKEIDTMTANIRAAVGFSDKAQMTEQLMTLVMEQAVEHPLYQRQLVTIYNTDTISEDSLNEINGYDGYVYALPYLRSN